MRRSPFATLFNLAILTGLLLSFAAGAAELRLTVPVEISGIPPELDQFTVFCDVYSERRAAHLAGSGRSMTLTGGAYRGDVVVSVTAPGFNPALAKEYQCDVSFVGWKAGLPHTADNQLLFFGTDYRARRDLPVAPGAVLTVSGRI